MVFSIRGNVYAHRNKAQIPHAAFAAARLAPKEMKVIVHLAQNTVASWADAAGLGSKAEVKRDIRRRQVLAQATENTWRVLNLPRVHHSRAATDGLMLLTHSRSVNSN